MNTSVLSFYSITLQPNQMNKISGRRVNSVAIPSGNRISYKAWIIFSSWTELTPSHSLTNLFIQSSQHLNSPEELLLWSFISCLHFKMLASTWITNICSDDVDFFFPLGVWQHLHLKHVSTELKADSANSYMRIPSKCDYKWSLNADFTNGNQLIQVEEFVLPSCILSGSFKVKICQGCALEILSKQTRDKNAH